MFGIRRKCGTAPGGGHRGRGWLVGPPARENTKSRDFVNFWDFVTSLLFSVLSVSRGTGRNTPAVEPFTQDARATRKTRGHGVPHVRDPQTSRLWVGECNCHQAIASPHTVSPYSCMTLGIMIMIIIPTRTIMIRQWGAGQSSPSLSSDELSHKGATGGNDARRIAPAQRGWK